MLILKIISAITFIAMLVVNFLANSLPIGGNTTGDISSKYNSLFTPAGFTFSIWGLIYLLLTVFVVLIFVNSNLLSQHSNTILILFIVTNILNIMWLLAWHHNLIFLSTIVMIFFLVILIIIIQTIPKTDLIPYITFSIYAGWISVAFIANVTVLILKHQLPIFINHEMVWFFIVLAISLAIGLTMLIKEKNYYFAGVFLWAYIGIATKFL